MMSTRQVSLDQVQVSFQEGGVDVSSWLQDKKHDSCGASVLFLGTVRNQQNGRVVQALKYDILKPLAEKILKQIGLKCIQNFVCAQEQTQSFLWITHAFGTLNVGETSVAILAQTPHRKEGFQIVEACIERLKEEVPIWKKEFYQDGQSAWVQGHTLCQKS